MKQKGSNGNINGTYRPKLLQETKGIPGESMHVIISKALENYRQLQFGNEVNEAYSKLKNDKRAWKEELEERNF
ncbi:MAG: hypothetical protein FD143_1128 [Ignavibacteria bacterium]|nr:MAG: hypothetical protein FD143_1128 [Ignavibacteria bacterium]KAF0161059.1 MAG: hypothetical protein FD188_1280 [Ignavibacteria bacterium]